MSDAGAGPLRIAVLHPELGLGGAERLIVDAALALRARGHAVAVHVAHHDPAHSFAATRDGRVAVRVHGARLPLHLAGHLRLPLALTRLLAAACGARREGRIDVILCDVAAQVVPLLRRLTPAPILFYGHYPDALLTLLRRGWYRWYRWPLDRWERAGLETADRLLVNSAFTAAAFRRAFPGLRRTPEVLHPGVDLADFATAAAPPSASHTILVVSRFVPEKNLPLALEAFAALRGQVPAALFGRLRLAFAGGFDARLDACRTAVDGLAAGAAAHGLVDQVALHHSPDDATLRVLYAGARCVVFTPPHEHFGYVPIEAMAAGRPVIAADAGGPTETVVDGATGFLRPQTAAACAAALLTLVTDPDRADRLGAAGRARVAVHFSLDAFADRLDAIVREVRRA